MIARNVEHLSRDHAVDVAANRLPVAWVGAVNGVIDVGGEVDRALEGIDQAFAQSPYLSRN